jgi:hypothetical protein
VDAGAEGLVVSLAERDAGKGSRCLSVVMVRRDSKEQVTDERAKEILRHFRNVGEFFEARSCGEIRRKAPSARLWYALPATKPPPLRSARRSIPAEPPNLRGKQLAPHLVAARRHLPATPPPGWSAPMAIDDLGGAWLIEPEDDCRILACLATVRERVVLAVTILPPLNEVVAEGHALEHLRHFRDIGEFVPEDVEEQMPGARLYLAELRTGGAEPTAAEKKSREMLN